VRICNPRLRSFRLKLEHPVVSARGSVRIRRGFLVQIEDETGAVGTGESTPYPAVGTETLDACRSALESMLRGLSGQRIPESGKQVNRLLIGQTPAPAARFGVELALLDLIGQRHRVPVSRLLRPDAGTRVRVSALLTQRAPTALAREARRLSRQGFRAFKVKIGAGTLARDRERVAAVRKAVGPRATLRLDANRAFEDLDAAAGALVELEPFGIELCEEPLAHPTPRTLSRLRARSPIPIAADETLADPARAAALVRSRAVDLLVLKPMVLGGLIPALELARRAKQAGIPSLVTTTLDGSVARLGAAHLAAALPRSAPAAGLATGRLFRQQGVDEPGRIDGGWFYLPRGTGLGLAPRKQR
jgi:o-succinylbenzoate synthase